MPPTITVTFFGTTTLYITDGETGIFIDAFFTRPSFFRIQFGRLVPDVGRITEALTRGNITRVDAVFAAHSHYDHVMDAPEVIKKLGGKLYGSSSTLNVGRGANLKEESMQLISEGEEYVINKFRVHIYEGLHSPGDRFPGTIDAPLRTPAKAAQYQTGKCYSFHITHPNGSILVHPSANFVPEKFTGLEVDVFYLGIGVLGAQDEEFQENYLQHTVEATKFDQIIPVHWDHLGKRLATPLQPLPRLLDNYSKTRRLLEKKVKDKGWVVRWQDAFETVQISRSPM